MHAQPRRGVHLDDATTLFFERFQYTFTDGINAADIQPDHLCRSDSTLGKLGVNVIGDIGRCAAGAKVGIVSQYDTRTRRRY